MLNISMIRETRRVNQEWTIQIYCQHWAHRTRDETSTIKKYNTTQNTKNMSNTDPTKKTGGGGEGVEPGCSRRVSRSCLL